MKNDGNGALEESLRRLVQKSAQRRDAPTFRRPNVMTLWERLNKPYLVKKI